MTSLPRGGEDVKQDRVLAWALEQAQYLTPTQHHVLLYLCISAWHKADNPENEPMGMVLSGLTALRKIQMGTGLSQRAVRNALDGLQDAGYILCKHRPGNGRSDIAVLWWEDFDEIREEFRAGVRDLPKEWQREIQRRPERIVGSSGSNIVPFRSGT